MSGSHQNSENLPGGEDRTGDSGQGGPTAEARARRLGWHPKAEFRGNPDDWVAADEFVRRGESHLPILRENLRKSDARAAKLEQDVATTRTEMSAMAAELSEARQGVMEMRNLLTTAEERSYQRAISELNKKMDTAIEEGDVDAAKAARKDLETVNAELAARAVKKAAPAPKADTAVKVDATAVQWVNSEDQAWYRDDLEAKGWADGLYDKMNADPKQRGLTIAEKLDRIRERAEKRFPELFPDPVQEGDGEDAEADPEPRRTAKVSSPRSPAAKQRQSGGGTAFDDIPNEDKQVFFRIEKQIAAQIKVIGRGKPYTKEEYAREYFTPKRD